MRLRGILRNRLKRLLLSKPESEDRKLRFRTERAGSLGRRSGIGEALVPRRASRQGVPPTGVGLLKA